LASTRCSGPARSIRPPIAASRRRSCPNDLSEQWGEFGEAALLECARTDPAAYCRIVASLLPKQSEKLRAKPVTKVIRSDGDR
jgi:hypothetical protein